ncbi:hypothetical protein ACP4OV_021730 [Aristida adscensionis]
MAAALHGSILGDRSIHDPSSKRWQTSKAMDLCGFVFSVHDSSRAPSSITAAIGEDLILLSLVLPIEICIIIAFTIAAYLLPTSSSFGVPHACYHNRKNQSPCLP